MISEWWTEIKLRYLWKEILSSKWTCLQQQGSNRLWFCSQACGVLIKIILCVFLFVRMEQLKSE
jgi:hypothetical protein